MDDPHSHHQHHRMPSLLEALKQASSTLHNTTNPFSSLLSKTDATAAIEALLELEPKAQALLSTDPSLRHLSNSLSNLKTLIQNLRSHHGGLRSLLSRQIATYKISKLARSLESEIQAYLDRLTIRDLVSALLRHENVNDDEQVNALVAFEKRLSEGFDLGFQDLVLRAKVFPILEQTLLRAQNKRVRERAASAIEALVKFNKNVFVGLLLMGPTIEALVEMGSGPSITVLTSLVRFIRSPLVDELLCSGKIPLIVEFLAGTRDTTVRAAALDCVLEIAYIGRREVIEAMLKEGLIGMLMELQRGCGSGDDVEGGGGSVIGFGDCVSRFGIQVEVGEGLSNEEKREVKLEILRMVKEASVSEAEAASVCAEILWGSSP